MKGRPVRVRPPCFPNPSSGISSHLLGCAGGKILLGQHDLSYRLFFSHVRMVRDLLRDIVGEAWVELIDFSSAERVNASFVSKKRKNRESDVIWKLRRRDTGDPIYVYVLLEFQSRPDRYMPVRLMTYTGLFYESLIAGSQLPPSGLLPQVIPVVLYDRGSGRADRAF